LTNALYARLMELPQLIPGEAEPSQTELDALP
jgi:hypothetical protein